ncbi:ribonuclease R [Thiorhodospira sibirica]|uniref:ribonuclease R n=1 Tax=Thiorhodospira sibirica TaxID=154347 RepID=UPI0005950D97|nr:ribonuclease R [Thiorhodospira sibirica]
MTKKNKKTLHDPHFQREAQKYENPIPSREFILEVIAQADGPMQFTPLAQMLELNDEQALEALSRRLRAMERDGQLVCNRKGAWLPVNQADLVRGRVIGHPDGFGFLVPDAGGADLFLSPKQMRALFHGDRALARVIGIDHRGRREGAVIEVLERNTQQVVGRLFMEGGIGFVMPDHKRITQDILIPPEHFNGAKPGQIVMVVIREQPSKRTRPIGQIVEIIGEHMGPGMEIDIAIRAHGIPFEWPDAVVEAANAMGTRVNPRAKQGRLDLRQMPLVTIDGEDAKDFDDAVYCEALPRSGFRLWVAIADVSHYVQPLDALDKEAQHRATSVYFPERVVPMLPEALSNGLCSLKPKVDRLALVCEMHITSRGNVKSYQFHEAVIRSHARLTYTEVAEALMDQEPKTCQRLEALLPHLQALYGLYQVLRAAREKRGAIDFESTETRIVFGENRKIERIVPYERNDAHKIIEECMIIANVCAARFLRRYRMPTLYRVHKGPTEEKAQDLRRFLGEQGLSLPGGEVPSPKDYAQLLHSIAERPDRSLIQTLLLRSLSQAVYSPDNIGHFGLAHEKYAHFTSPIRRYPDLLVHRGIRHVLNGGKPREFHYSLNDMVSLGEHSSMAERRADEATWDAIGWLKCEYMQDKIGECFDGLITTVTSFGLFVELQEIYVEGLVHVTSLHNDYYVFDPAGHRLRGERSGRVYCMGDRLRVRVARVNLDERKIDFALEEGPSSASGKKPAAQLPAATPGSAPKKSRRKRHKAKTQAQTQTQTELPAEKKTKAADTASPGRRSRSGRSRRRKPAAKDTP